MKFHGEASSPNNLDSCLELLIGFDDCFLSFLTQEQFQILVESALKIQERPFQNTKISKTFGGSRMFRLRLDLSKSTVNLIRVNLLLILLLLLKMQKINRKFHLSKTKISRFNNLGGHVPFYFASAAWGADIVLKVRNKQSVKSVKNIIHNCRLLISFNCYFIIII